MRHLIKLSEADKEVKVKNEKPPVWDDICGAFKINPVAYFTYGDTIYNPSELPLLPEIIAHEKVHMEQQSDEALLLPQERTTDIVGNKDAMAALWWGKYLRDPQFRLDQEARAYGRQYEFICKVVKDRNQRNKYLVSMGASLSGPLYNKCVGLFGAINLIKSYAQVN